MKKIIIAIIIGILLAIGLGGYFLVYNFDIKIIPKLKVPENYKISSNINITAVSKNNELLHETIKKIGIKESMRLLVEESGGGSQYDCHQPAHDIGRIGYAVEKKNAFGGCSADCHSGCYHGAMESFLAEKGTENLAANIVEVCKKFETSFGNFQCLHGVGHGLLAYVDYDMPQAIKECQKLPDSFSQTSCYGGMFMENILTGQGLGASEKKDHTTKWVNKTDPYFPCNKIDKDQALQYQCYQMQTSWMLKLASYDFNIVAKQCLNAPDDIKSVCFKSFGRDAAGHTLRNPQKILDICAKVPQQKDYYMQCLTGAVNVIVDFWGPGLKDQASQLCALTPESHRKNCYQIVAGRLPNLFKEKSDQQKVCQTFEPAYQNLCQ